MQIDLIHKLGRGVAKSMENATRYYRLAACQGYVHAQQNLGEHEFI